MMTSDEIRAAYLAFFKSNGHTVVPSSSLIPQGDPTLLLTTAGMVQFKAYYTGEAVPPNRRLASCQKCFRMTDIDDVGDNRHLTFFEMLGNFSIGDYFKKEAITWAWEFVTKVIKLPEESLLVTIYLDDEEAFRIWRGIGVPESRIYRLGEKDNFWGPAGNSGPCGPCSEIHYDFGKGCGCGKPNCGPGCSCGRFSEIWNLVFTQYNQDKDGKRSLLPSPNIDTGMGLERVTTILQGKQTVYEADLFAPLVAKISQIAGKTYGKKEEIDYAMRVIAEHSRGITFLIGDGVIPGNEGRGYVLRRLLRRTTTFARRLGLHKPFLTEMAKIVIGQMGGTYPEVNQRQDFILKVVELEEARFQQTLDTGLELIENIIDAAGIAKAISGKDAFRLYDTYGFPVELTKEIADARGVTVDVSGFEAEMTKQRQQARASHKFANGDAGVTGLKEKLDVAATTFIGYGNLSERSSILTLLVDGELVGTIGEGQTATVILESTPFYAEMGGQIGDTGEIVSRSGKFNVENTVLGLGGVVLHQGKLEEGVLSAGEDARATVNEERRKDIARNHTATHLLQYALRQVLGDHVQQRGSLVAPARLRFDFSHLTPLSPSELRRVQLIINEKVRQDLPVYAGEISYQQAVREGATALFGEKYGEVVRVLKIGRPPVSTELCGGTHVSTTGEIGYFLILAESSVGAGLRRIEAATGREAETIVDSTFNALNGIARQLGVRPEVEAITDKITALTSDLGEAKRKVESLEREHSKGIVDSLLGQTESVDGINLLVAKITDTRPQTLREMGDMLRDKLKSAVIVLATVYEEKPAFIAVVTPDLVAKGYHAGKIIKKVAAVAGGGGGGKPEMAQAGGKDRSKIDEALRLVRQTLSLST